MKTFIVNPETRFLDEPITDADMEIVTTDTIYEADPTGESEGHEVTYEYHNYYYANMRNMIQLIYRKEIARIPYLNIVSDKTLQETVDYSKKVIAAVTELKAMVPTLIGDMPLKNQQQRDLALTKCLTDETFARKYLELPEAYQSSIIA